MLRIVLILLLSTAFATSAAAQTAAIGPSLIPPGIGGPQQWTSPEGISSTLQVMLLLTVVSLAPAILLMTTSFIRILIVMGLLRQAIGTQQLPPSQVLTSIALFMTALLMTPVWTKVYDDAIKPYSANEIGLEDAWNRGTQPIRRFMAEQIRRTDNDDDVHLFLNPEVLAWRSRPENGGASR
jgi:flagellar biosynthesis protein FliP